MDSLDFHMFLAEIPRISFILSEFYSNKNFAKLLFYKLFDKTEKLTKCDHGQLYKTKTNK